MGYYEGVRKEPCPRCGGVVGTLFISVTPMAYYESCRSCSWPAPQMGDIRLRPDLTKDSDPAHDFDGPDPFETVS